MLPVARRDEFLAAYRLLIRDIFASIARIDRLLARIRDRPHAQAPGE